MIVTQAPLRVSFLGGGSDFRQHFSVHGGAVLATAIDRFAYVTAQTFLDEFFDHGLRVAYRKTEAVQNSACVEHPAIRACLQKLGIEKGIELHHMADLPARTGLGSSSSFVVAMLMALHTFQGRTRSKLELAEEAIEVERGLLAEAGGHQDQIVAAYGGTSLIRFEKSGRFSVTPLSINPNRLDDLQEHLLLMYTGLQRDSFAQAEAQIASATRNHRALNQLASLAEEGAECLVGRAPLTSFGKLLHDGWLLKRELSAVSLPSIDEAYEAGLRAGAAGGKLLGAGGGGFLLFVAEPTRHATIRAALPHMRSIRVGINAPGARVIFAQATA